jgi:glucose dehydrogenase
MSEAQARSAAAYVAGDDWPYYNGDPGSTHYSSLRSINTNNVGKLNIAWEYDTHDEIDTPSEHTMESNPLIVRGHLFFVSPKGRLICLDGATGRELWTFEPKESEKDLTGRGSAPSHSFRNQAKSLCTRCRHWQTCKQLRHKWSSKIGHFREQPEYNTRCNL